MHYDITVLITYRVMSI